MIIIFLVGFIFTLFGSIGYDAMSIISYVVSEGNLKSENGILVDKLGEASSYLDRCINGDGKIEEALGLKGQDIGSFDNINIVQDQIREAEKNFTQMKDCVALRGISEQIEGRYNFSIPTLMLIKDNKDYPTNSDNLDMKDYLVFNYYLEGMNVAIRNAGNNYESWSTTTGDKDKTCTEDISYDEEIIFYPSKCKL